MGISIAKGKESIIWNAINGYFSAIVAGKSFCISKNLKLKDLGRQPYKKSFQEKSCFCS